MAAIRVLIVDDHKLFADAIRPALQRQGMEVIGVATTGSEALEIVRGDHPDAVLVDIGLPDRSGLVVGAQVLEESPGTTVIAVTALQDARMMKEAARLGFHGFLSKDTNLPKFVNSVRAALGGEMVFPRMAGRKNTAGSEAQRTALLTDQLTAREREVLALLSQGATSQGVADALHIAPNTVRTHVQNILSKLQVHSRLEAVAFAARAGVAANGGRGVRIARPHSARRHGGA